MDKNETLIFIPTYNESENVEKIYSRIKDLKLSLDFLFLDDNSPDGTGKIINLLAEKDSQIAVIHRNEKKGIGSAHLEGINYAYKNHYKILITMDCDFSHKPEYIPLFIKYSNNYDVVVGSRFLRSDSLKGWNLFRKCLTLLGHFVTKIFLGLPYDATGAFRLYRIDKIDPGLFDLVQTKGYSFFFESLYILFLNSIKIKEVSIDLPFRVYGHSKMTLRDAFKSLSCIISIFMKTRINKKRYILVRPISKEKNNSCRSANLEWDKYWQKKINKENIIYNFIASFYRKYIIKQILNYFIRKYNHAGESILHAGCGSGEVDIDISNEFRLTALDISPAALNLYREYNKNVFQLVQGDLFNLSFEEKSFDCIYNLGVMEHFSEEQIGRILGEFHRVLKDNGRIILFWPPEFGLSVIFLKLVHFILNDIFKKNVKLHPDEITRVKSKSHVEKNIANSNFKLSEYYFGIKDIFTHIVIVCEKKYNVAGSKQG